MVKFSTKLKNTRYQVSTLSGVTKDFKTLALAKRFAKLKSEDTGKSYFVIKKTVLGSFIK